MLEENLWRDDVQPEALIAGYLSDKAGQKPVVWDGKSPKESVPEASKPKMLWEHEADERKMWNELEETKKA